MNTDLMTGLGIKLPRIIYGTAWKKERTAVLVEQALALGFRGIDTAGQPKHYDEAGVGLGLAQAMKLGLNRQDIYLQTKFTPLDGQDPQRIPYDPKASLSRQVEQSFAQSLQNLRTDYLDGLILHSPLPKRKDLLEVWAAMECIVDAGGARLLGISNCYELEQLGTSIKPDFSGVISPSGLPGDSQAIFESLMVRFGLFCLPIPPNRPHFRRSGGFRALESYHSHSVEIG